MEIIPYIFFNGRPEVAMKFYEKVLGEYKGPPPEDFAPDQKNRITFHAPE